MPADVNILERYCLLTVRRQECDKLIAKHGITRHADDGGGLQPFVRESRSLGVMLLNIEREFGGTPASRSRIHLNKRPKLPGKAAPYLA